MLCRFSPLSRGLNVMREENEFAPTVQILVREAHFLQAAARRGESTRLAPCVPATAKVRITTRLMLCRFSPLSRGLNVMREANEFAPSVQILVREACFLQAAARRGRIYSLGTLCSGNYEGATSYAADAVPFFAAIAWPERYA
jgi:hypothetical protein